MLFLCAPFPGIRSISALAQADIEGHHDHKSQDGGPGCQLPITTGDGEKSKTLAQSGTLSMLQVSSAIHISDRNDTSAINNDNNIAMPGKLINSWNPEG